MMSGQKLITTSTILYAIFGLIVGFVVSWFLGWVFVGWMRSTGIATGWITAIWLTLLIVVGLWAISLIPAMKTGMRGLPQAAFLWSAWLAILVVFLVSLFQGLAAFGF